MHQRVRLLGPAGTVTELVASVLRLGGHLVDVTDSAGPAEDADVLVVLSPGPAEWDIASDFGGGVVVVTERQPGDAEVVEATLAGADAVVYLDVSPTELLQAVDAVRAGGTMLTPAQARRVAEAARSRMTAGRPVLRLTPREQSILESTERGESVKQTARSLGIAPKTVENVQSRLFRKLGARNRAHAVVLAHRFGLLPEPEPARR